MPVKIPVSIKKLYADWWIQMNRLWQLQNRPTGALYPKFYTIKLATLQLTPKLKLLSFRVSKNYMYFSFAKPNSDLTDLTELFSEEDVEQTSTSLTKTVESQLFHQSGELPTLSSIQSRYLETCDLENTGEIPFLPLHSL